MDTFLDKFRELYVKKLLAAETGEEALERELSGFLKWMYNFSWDQFGSDWTYETFNAIFAELGIELEDL